MNQLKKGARYFFRRFALTTVVLLSCNITLLHTYAIKMLEQMSD